MKVSSHSFGVFLFLFLLVVTGPSDSIGHECIHDTKQNEFMATIHRDAPVPISVRADVPTTTTTSETSSKRDSRVTGPLRFHVDTTRLDPSSDSGTVYCSSCSSGLTPAKTAYVRDVVIPRATKWLSDALRVVDPISGKETVKSSKCADVSGIGAPLTTTGVDADFIVFVTARATQGSTLAWAVYCAVKASGRPYVGQINFGPANVNPSTNEDDILRDVAVFVHELAHALGFSSNAFGNFLDRDGNPWNEVLDQVDVHGVTRSVFKTPTVLREAKRHFACNTMTFLELEEAGGGGTAGSHWEKRTMGNEFMTGVIGMDAKFSAVSLALFEDSGWYVADYSVIEGDFVYGSRRGCNFAQGSCDAWGVDYFCNEIDSDGCAPDGLTRGTCGTRIHQSSIVPSAFQYFSDPKRGGSDEVADYCPMWVPYSNGPCWDVDNSPSQAALYGEEYGKTSRCLRGNFLSDKYSNSGAMKGQCFKTQCVVKNNAMTLEVTVGDNTYICTKIGQEITNVPGMITGRKAICPDPVNSCPQSPPEAPTCESGATSGSITVSWRAGINPTKAGPLTYVVYRNKGGSDNSYTTQVYSGSSKSTTVTGLTGGVSYKFRVVARVTGLGESPLGTVSAACKATGGGGSSGTPTPTPTPTPTAAASATPAATASPTPTPSTAPLASSSPTPSASPTGNGNDTNTPDGSPSPVFMSPSPVPLCPGTPICSGHGVCSSDDVCVCDSGWSLSLNTKSCDVSDYPTVVVTDGEGVPIESIVSSKEYVYFMVDLDPVERNVIVTLTVGEEAMDADIVMGPMHKTPPTLESHTWLSVHRGGEVMHIEHSDPLLSSGEYLIGVYGHSEGRSSFGLTVSYTPITHEAPLPCPYQGCSKRGTCVASTTESKCIDCDKGFRGIGCHIDDTETTDVTLSEKVLEDVGMVVSSSFDSGEGSGSSKERKKTFYVPFPTLAEVVIAVEAGSIKMLVGLARDEHPTEDTATWTTSDPSDPIRLDKTDSRLKDAEGLYIVVIPNGSSRQSSSSLSSSSDFSFRIAYADVENVSLLMICPADCSGHGTCVNGKCDCSSGFSGDACSSSSSGNDGEDAWYKSSAGMVGLAVGGILVVVGGVVGAAMAAKKKKQRSVANAGRRKLHDRAAAYEQNAAAAGGGGGGGGGGPSAAPPAPPRPAGVAASKPPPPPPPASSSSSSPGAPPKPPRTWQRPANTPPPPPPR